MTKYLVAMKGATRFSNGKSADIAYAIKGTPKIVVFDFSRSQEEHLNYAIIEDVKNGLVFSPKYESCCKIFPIPHVIVFANWPPDMNKMSIDRWDINLITDDDCQYIQTQEEILAELQNFISK